MNNNRSQTPQAPPLDQNDTLQHQPATVPLPPLPPIQPAAYDTLGRPLYHHPPAMHHDNQNSQSLIEQRQNANNQPNSSDAQSSSQVSEEVSARHSRTLKKYPELSLNETEYVVRRVKRHPIGLFYIWVAEVTAMVLLAAAWLALIINPVFATGILETRESQFYLALAMIALQLFLLVIGWVGTIVYQGNQFFVTNERVIQYIQTGLFAKKRQTINLKGVEDVSYRQEGISQHVMNYGTIRLSTVGDESSYRFTFVESPAKVSAHFNEVVQARKNERDMPEEYIETDILH